MISRMKNAVINGFRLQIVQVLLGSIRPLATQDLNLALEVIPPCMLSLLLCKMRKKYIQNYSL